MRQSKFRRICVFCGSSQGRKSSYQDAAIELGKELVFYFLFGFPLFFCSSWASSNPWVFRSIFWWGVFLSQPLNVVFISLLFTFSFELIVHKWSFLFFPYSSPPPPPLSFDVYSILCFLCSCHNCLSKSPFQFSFCGLCFFCHLNAFWNFPILLLTWL